MRNLLAEDKDKPTTLLGLPLYKVVARLDALLFVLKSCKGQTCVKPWQALHPAGNVLNLYDALAHRFDNFYEVQQRKIQYRRCEMGYIKDAEGLQFETDGIVYRQNLHWSEWV
jgi:hypothetical protein